MTMVVTKHLLRQERGMTMAELVIVLAITGALSVFMGTELQAMADQVYLNTAVAEVVGDLRFARSLAVREGQTIRGSLRPDPPGVTFYPYCVFPHAVAPVADPRKHGIRTIHLT